MLEQVGPQSSSMKLRRKNPAMPSCCLSYPPFASYLRKGNRQDRQTVETLIAERRRTNHACCRPSFMAASDLLWA